VVQNFRLAVNINEIAKMVWKHGRVPGSRR